MLFALGAGGLIERLAQTANAAGCAGGQGLHAGQTGECVQAGTTPLRADIEGRDRVDLIAPELNAHGRIGAGREHVQNAAAHRELTRAFDLCAALIACRDQLCRQIGERGQVTDSDGQRRIMKHRRRQGFLHECGSRYGDERCVGQLRQRRDACLLVLTGHAFHASHGQFACGDVQDGQLGEGFQIGSQTKCSVVLVGQDADRARGFQTERSGELCLGGRRQTDGERRGLTRPDGLK